MCAFLWVCFCYFLHGKERGDDYNQGEITAIYQRAGNVIFSPKQSSTPFVFYLHRAKKSFIFQCLYHLKVAAKPAKLFSAFSPRPSHYPPICGLACEDLLPWWQWGSMWRGDVLSYRALLISQLSSQGCAEGQLHNRMIHHAGLTHLSHV